MKINKPLNAEDQEGINLLSNEEMTLQPIPLLGFRFDENDISIRNKYKEIFKKTNPHPIFLRSGSCSRKGKKKLQDLIKTTIDHEDPIFDFTKKSYDSQQYLDKAGFVHYLDLVNHVTASFFDNCITRLAIGRPRIVGLFDPGHPANGALVKLDYDRLFINPLLDFKEKLKTFNYTPNRIPIKDESCVMKNLIVECKHYSFDNILTAEKCQQLAIDNFKNGYSFVSKTRRNKIDIDKEFNSASCCYKIIFPIIINYLWNLIDHVIVKVREQKAAQVLGQEGLIRLANNILFVLSGKGANYCCVEGKEFHTKIIDRKKFEEYLSPGRFFGEHVRSDFFFLSKSLENRQLIPFYRAEIKKESRKDAPIASQVLNVAKDRGVAIGYKHSAVALHHETKEDKRYLQNDNKNRDVNIDRVVDIAYNHSGVAFQHETKEDIRYLQNDTNNQVYGEVGSNENLDEFHSENTIAKNKAVAKEFEQGDYVDVLDGTAAVIDTNATGQPVVVINRGNHCGASVTEGNQENYQHDGTDRAQAAYAELTKSVDLHHNNGDSTYAEMTKRSMKYTTDYLFEHVLPQTDNMHQYIEEKKTLIIDFGCGTCTVLGSLSAALGCDALGIEYSYSRCYITLSHLKNILNRQRDDISDKDRIDDMFRIGFVPMNIHKIPNLSFVHELGYQAILVFLGDEAFPNDLMNKTADLINSTHLSTLVISGKQARHSRKIDGWGDFWQNERFRHLGEIHWRKTGSGEVGKNHFYYRTQNNQVKRNDTNDSISQLLKECLLKNGWLSNATYTQRYEWIHCAESIIASENNLGISLPPKRRRKPRLIVETNLDDIEHEYNENAGVNELPFVSSNSERESTEDEKALDSSSAVEDETTVDENEVAMDASQVRLFYGERSYNTNNDNDDDDDDDDDDETTYMVKHILDGLKVRLRYGDEDEDDDT